MRRLAQALLHRNEARLQPSLQRFLTAVMDGQPTESELQEDYHHLIYQAHPVPNVLLAPKALQSSIILPHLDEECRHV